MPRSSTEGKDQIEKWLKDITPQHQKIIDIATGQGTYKDLFSNLKNLNNCKWYGVEIWPRWIKKFNLKEKYDFLFEEDVRTFNYKKHGPFDVAFVGDVLEHMTKTEAIQLIDNLKENASTIFISIPIIYMPQGPDGGNPYEIHIKPDWSHDEVLDSFSEIKDFRKGKKIGVYMIT
jgi:hypothetical protein